MIALGIATGLLVLLRVVAWRLGPAPIDWTCSTCGYLVRGLRSEICPECGSNLRRAGAVRVERRWRSLARHPNLKRLCNIGVPVLVVVLAYRAGPALLPARWLVSLRDLWGTQAVIYELETLKAPSASWSEPVLRDLLASDDPELIHFALDVIKARPVPVGGADGIAGDILVWQAETKRPWRNELGELFEVLADRSVLRADVVDRYVAHALAAEACIQAPPLSNGQVTVLMRLQWRAARTASAYLIDPADPDQTPRGLAVIAVVGADISVVSRGLSVMHRYGMRPVDAPPTVLTVMPRGWRPVTTEDRDGAGNAAADSIANHLQAAFCINIASQEEGQSTQGMRIGLIPADEQWNGDRLTVEWSPANARAGLERMYTRHQLQRDLVEIECAYVARYGDAVEQGHFLLAGRGERIGQLTHARGRSLATSTFGEAPVIQAVGPSETRMVIWAVSTRASHTEWGWERLETPVELVFQTCW